MGGSWSSMSECLGDFSNAPSSSNASRYGRLPPPRRVVSNTSSTSTASSTSSTSTTQQHQHQHQHQQHSQSQSQQQQQRQQQESQQQRQGDRYRQRCMSDDKFNAKLVSSHGAAIPPPPPPLIPDSNAVYNLLDDENEDVCPTCLECYAKDNPKISSSCGHSFHLQCIVAWETRSGTRFCPICAKVMEYVEA